MPMFLRKCLHAVYIALMKTFIYLSPSLRHTTYAGSGSAYQLCLQVVNSGVKKLLVVTDKPLRDLGIVDQAIQGLEGSGVDVVFYDGVLPDPTYSQVMEGAAIAKNHGSEAVLAIGGGSSIDAAKIIAAAATSDDNPVDWVGHGKVKHDLLPIYAIPTTSGTGSEATMGAVISDSETHEKGVTSGPGLLPVAAALDPDLIMGLPPHITAATGMDALTHAIEAYISPWERGTRSGDSSMAIKMIFDNLPLVYHDGSNREARAAMALAAYYAGLAINQVNVGNVHAIAHQIGSRYGIPHGLSNALVLPHVLEFCHEEAKGRMAQLAVLIGLGTEGEDDGTLAHKFIKAVRDLRTEVGIPDHSELIKREDFDALTKAAMAEGFLYPAPRLLDRKSTEAILNSVAA
ncbi:MAG: iron-containing alcohol dehydrogenase [Pseudomonadota bacterium]